MKTLPEIESILTQIRDHLDAHAKRTGVSLHVDPDGYVQDDEWLNVVVSPDRPGVRAYDYVEALSQIENTLKQDGFVNVLLVPAMAD